MNKILVLGSGYMARPVVSYLSSCRDYDITVASRRLNKAEEITSLYERTTPVELSVHNEPGLSKLISSSDLVISLVQDFNHQPVFKSCLHHKVHMLTSSYVTPEMMKLQQQIKDAGIMVFNEIGFDPGIDHMLTKQCIDDVHEKGGKVLSYMSWSAGLPVPEAANVPLKYKFSWSPPTVMLQPLSSASWLQDGKVITVPEGRVMYHPQHLDLSHIIPEVEFEGIVNPSIKYIDFYNIPEVHSLVRGSIRYKGFSATMCSLQQIGLITDEQHRKLQPGSPPITWQDLLADLMQTSVSTLKDVVFKRIDYDSHSLKEIEAMGLLSTEKVPQMGSPSQSLAKHLTGILSYKPGEQDVAIIYNVIDVEWPDKSKERKTVTFVDYGDIGGFTAMDKTVGFPTGIAAKMILEGRIPRKGIVLPVTKDIYEPILEELKTYVKPAAVLSTAL